MSVDAVAAALEHQATLVDGADHGNQKTVLLRVVDDRGPSRPNYQLAAQPMAALDLLEDSDPGL